MKQAYHHKDLRNALIEEAQAVLAGSGPADLTLRELARRLGVTHTAPYAHFSDKRQLLEAIADAGFARLADQLEDAARGEGDPLKAFRAVASRYLTFAQENANLYRLMFADDELNDPECEWSPEGERAFAAVVEVIGQIGAPPGIDPRELAAVAWSVVHGVAMLDIDQRIGAKMQSPQAVLSLAVDIMLRGLSARANEGGAGA